MGRGKIGDIVLSRSNGQQIARVRNRNPKKSKTNAQLYQRAIMATVMQAYSAGKAIFDHSFQGKSVGQQNMAEFLKLNAKALRQQLATEVNTLTAEEDCKAHVTAPGVKMAIPNEYIVSRGSLTNNIMSNDGLFVNQPTEGETVKAWLTRNGFQTDDILTFVFINVSSDNVVSYGDDYASIKQSQFGYVQLRPKASAFNSESIITGKTKTNTVFDIIMVNVTNTNVEDFTIDCTIREEIIDANISYAVIRSHENSGLRSNAQMTVKNTEVNGWGLTYQYLLEAWSNGTVPVGDSDLILEGSGF